MKPQEAIPILERLQEPEAWEPQISRDAYEALEMAIEALEKQIPKKPQKVEDRYCENLYTAYCPICHWMLARGNYRTGYVDTIHKNCPECLQRIDWTEGEG